MDSNEMKNQLDAALLENARLRRLAESRKERIRAITESTQHNHITRDVKPIGECPGCDSRARLLAEIEYLRLDRDSWFEEFNALRDQGEPSWDMFDITVAATVQPYEELRVALSNYMDKPWSQVDDWWGRVREVFLSLSPDWPQGDDNFQDPYQLGMEHGLLLEEAGPWTKEELDAIREKARVRAAELRELAD